MDKKYIFLDLDGTIIDHSTNSVPESAKLAIKQLQANGHEVIIATGRPYSLFYGIEKDLEIPSYIAANGRYVVINGELIYSKPIDPEVVKAVTDYAYENKIDIGFESDSEYVVNSRFTDYSDKFSETYHLHYPELKHNFHLSHDIHQLVLFYTASDFKKFEDMYPTLSFNYSNAYGLDINEKGGLKDIGLKEVVNHFNLDIKNVIAVGDGFNDISMIEYAGVGIAMGNAQDPIKESADYVTDDISNDGLYKAFKHLNLI